VLRQLEAQGEKVKDQRMLIQQLLSKFPVRHNTNSRGGQIKGQRRTDGYYYKPPSEKQGNRTQAVKAFLVDRKRGLNHNIRVFFARAVIVCSPFLLEVTLKFHL